MSHSIACLGTEPIVATWASALGLELTDDLARASVVVFAPSAPAPPVPSQVCVVACLPVLRDDAWSMADGATMHAAVRADAYASCPRSLADALEHALSEDRDERMRGPLRLVWLGALGELFPSVPAIGDAFTLASPATIGRQDSCEIRLLQEGPSRVARRHARVAVVGAEVQLRDFGTTNGVYVRGSRVSVATLHPGDELAVSGTMRLRLDGAAT